MKKLSHEARLRKAVQSCLRLGLPKSWIWLQMKRLGYEREDYRILGEVVDVPLPPEEPVPSLIDPTQLELF